MLLIDRKNKTLRTVERTRRLIITAQGMRGLRRVARSFEVVLFSPSPGYNHVHMIARCYQHQQDVLTLRRGVLSLELAKHRLIRKLPKISVWHKLERLWVDRRGRYFVFSTC